MRYALSRATRRSSLDYAAAASLIARCHPRFREKYLDSAIRAWDFALREKPCTLLFEVHRTDMHVIESTDTIYWDESPDLPASSFAKAAANLHALTGDARRKNADEILGQMGSAYAYRAPWHAPQTGWVQAMSFGQSHPLVRARWLIAADALFTDPKYLDAASIANDFHNGCNPSDTTLTSGLGDVYPVAFLDLPSYVDGIAEYVPGITPYRWTYALPPRIVQRIFGGDRSKATSWPIWRRWGNMENQTVKASEYTVWETIGPAASVTAYLTDPTGTPPPVRPEPAKSLRDLEGYWLLP